MSPRRIPPRNANHYDFTELRRYTVAGKELTPREHQVVAMMAWGYSDKIIADYLNSNVKAVQMVIMKVNRRYGWDRKEMAKTYANEIGL